MGTIRDPDVLPPPAPDADASSSFALLLRARAGDEAARNELCARYLPRLRRWAHGRLPVWARDHLDTEDIVQDALMKSVRRLDTFAPEHERAVCRQLLSRYDAALQQLRESDRELVVARVELGLDYGDIASLSGRPSAAAVRIAVSRALVRLAAEMGHARRA